MARSNHNTRISTDLFKVRRNHKNILADAFNGLKISEIDIDRLYAKKLQNINIIEEFFPNAKRKQKR